MKGFPKGFHSHINRFPKLLQKLFKNLRKMSTSADLGKFVRVLLLAFRVLS
jgi:hypothetical protein